MQDFRMSDTYSDTLSLHKIVISMNENALSCISSVVLLIMYIQDSCINDLKFVKNQNLVINYNH